MEKKKKKPKKKVGETAKRNITWQVNQKLCQETYVELIQKLRRCPTTKEVSEHVRLSIKAIDTHISELSFEPQKNLLRVLTQDVLVSIYNSSRKGSPASQKLWLQVMEGWKESSEIDLGFKKSIRDLMEEDEAD